MTNQAQSPNAQGLSVANALWQARLRLKRVSDSPDLDARWLLQHVLRQHETSWLLAHGEEELSDDQESKFEELVGRRLTGEPLAYILGEWDFYGRRFYVTPDVLVPRPSTEALVAKALEVLKSRRDVTTVADVGTGSGCIAVTLACELANFRILATDLSEAALDVARKNAEKHGASDRVEFIKSDMLEFLAPTPSPSSMGRVVDLIVSNPPYVPTEELARAGRDRDTRGLIFEPKIALDGGPDGLRFVREIKEAGVPAIIEGFGGKVLTHLPREAVRG